MAGKKPKGRSTPVPQTRALVASQRAAVPSSFPGLRGRLQQLPPGSEPPPLRAPPKPERPPRQPPEPRRKRAAASAPHPLAVRLGALLGVSVEEALERALRELAERLGMHNLPAAAGAQAAAPAAGTGAGGAGAPAADAGETRARSAHAPAPVSAGNTIPAAPLDTTPLAARTSSAASAQPAFSPGWLPKRLYLALDGRGLDGGGVPVEVIDLPCTIGSSRRCAIWINSPRIETQHAQISESPEGWVLEDLGSEHGTFFNGERITRRVLQDGDLFLLAGYLRLKAELR